MKKSVLRSLIMLLLLTESQAKEEKPKTQSISFFAQTIQQELEKTDPSFFDNAPRQQHFILSTIFSSVNLNLNYEFVHGQCGRQEQLTRKMKSDDEFSNLFFKLYIPIAMEYACDGKKLKKGANLITLDMTPIIAKIVK